MKSSLRRRALLGALALMFILAISALPATADSFGPAFFCDAGTLNNCTDTSNPALAEDTFSCGGTAGSVASCTNQITGESSPYCPFMGEESSKNRDVYMCGPPSDFSNQIVDRFWQQVD